MRPLIVHTSSFYNFTTTVIREPMPFDPWWRFKEFCALAENLILSEQVYAWNIGAYNFEWENGYYTIFENTPSTHPYEPFGVLGNVAAAPLEMMLYDTAKESLVEMVPQEEQERVFHEQFGDLQHAFTLSVALSMYTQAYNGVFGEVIVREPAMLSAVLPRLLSYVDGKGAIVLDPLINQALGLLNNAFYDELSRLTFSNITRIKIPPLAAVLLNRLPDNCDDPYRILLEIDGLRNELTSVRRKFAELEAAIYSDAVSVKDVSEAKKAIEIDASAFKRYTSIEGENSVVFRWFADTLSFACKALIAQGVSVDSIVNLLVKFVPSVERRLRVKSPSRLLQVGKDAYKLRGYESLAFRKLDLLL